MFALSNKMVSLRCMILLCAFSKAIANCQLCRAGTFCDVTGEVYLCTNCPIGTFQYVSNVAHSCERCKSHCIDILMDLRSTCNATTDNTCFCKVGYHFIEKNNRGDGYCKEHSKCTPGYGVQKNGSHDDDTVCEACMPGTTYSLPGEPCLLCTVCDKLGQHENAPCNIEADAICEQSDILSDSGNTDGNICLSTGELSAIVVCTFVIGVIIGVCLLALVQYCRKISQSQLSLGSFLRDCTSIRICDRSHHESKENDCPLPTQERIPDLQSIFIELCPKLIRDYKKFFRQLYQCSRLQNVEDVLEKEVHSHHQDEPDEVIHSLFKEWKKIMGSKASIELIEKALKSVGRMDLVDLMSP